MKFIKDNQILIGLVILSIALVILAIALYFGLTYEEVEPTKRRIPL
jgi:hypothetical protein